MSSGDYFYKDIKIVRPKIDAFRWLTILADTPNLNQNLYFIHGTVGYRSENPENLCFKWFDENTQGFYMGIINDEFIFPESGYYPCSVLNNRVLVCYMTSFGAYDVLSQPSFGINFPGIKYVREQSGLTSYWGPVSYTGYTVLRKHGPSLAAKLDPPKENENDAGGG
jgi:hypothetical protein